jgi:hemin uptake protein HemP
MFEKDRTPKSHQQDQAYKSVCRKERRIQSAQIVGPHQRMLIN